MKSCNLRVVCACKRFRDAIGTQLHVKGKLKLSELVECRGMAWTTIENQYASCLPVMMVLNTTDGTLNAIIACKDDSEKFDTVVKYIGHGQILQKISNKIWLASVTPEKGCDKLKQCIEICGKFRLEIGNVLRDLIQYRECNIQIEYLLNDILDTVINYPVIDLTPSIKRILSRYYVLPNRGDVLKRLSKLFESKKGLLNINKVKNHIAKYGHPDAQTMFTFYFERK